VSEAEEIAKAVQSVAKFGDNALETSQKVGGFFARVFKEPIQEVSGMVTDKLRFVRWQRLVAMSDEVNKILEDRGVKDTRSVPPKLALPILEESSLEQDPNLQQLWNRLLANAMDPKFNGELRYGFVDMIKNITGVEAMILNNFYEILKREGHTTDLSKITDYHLKKEQIMQMVGIDASTYQVSIFNLMRMQCIGPAILTGGISMGEEPVTIYKGSNAVVLTPLGVKFVEACIK
jgi:Abortive infection alpha